ncbi:MAG: poly(A) polymerase, partial [Bdellovibrio sp.]|nr:poly(A) polymerase [Bdellovibrio sp.]
MTSANHSSLMKTYTNKLQTMHDAIDSQAIGILKRLKEGGFEAYLVGGCVRDLLVGIKPKDFDIATNALPNMVKKKVPYCFIIGRRFKLVHARRGDQIYEIATFRRAASAEELQATDDDNKLFTEENFFGNLEEDSWRRDFTVNALFYDPIDKKIVDYCGGLDDIKSHTLRMIGDPVERLKEDPVRILRAIRLSQKIHFSIAPDLRQAIHDLKSELLRANLPRRREEWLKFLRLPQADLALMELFDLGVFEIVLPSLHALFLDEAKREEFLCYINQFHHIGINFSDATELFSAFLYAYLMVTQPTNLDLHSLEEDEKFLLFCRDELGVFKAEVAIFVKSLQFINSLKKIEPYKQKGDRRKFAMLK